MKEEVEQYMFAEGEYISYGCNGVCKVDGIVEREVPDTKEKREYYVLRPVYNKGGIIYSPVDGSKISARRRIMTREESYDLLDHVSQVERIEEKDKKAMELRCKEAVQSGECREWMIVIKTLLYERKQRLGQGKKLTSTGERYLKEAKDRLCGELAVALEQERKQVENLLKQKLEMEG